MDGLIKHKQISLIDNLLKIHSKLSFKGITLKLFKRQIMKLDINKTNLLYTVNQEEKEISNKVLDYILSKGYTLQSEYNKENSDNIEIDFIELLEDNHELEINYNYGFGYVLTFETWDNMEELLNNI